MSDGTEYPDRDAAAVQLAHLGREFYRMGWMLGTAGNLSARLSADSYVITATGGHKGELNNRSFVGYTLGMRDPSPATSRGSAETEVHDVLYERHPGIGAVLHVHAPYVTLVSRLDISSRGMAVAGFEYAKGLGIMEQKGEVFVPIARNHAEIPKLAEEVLSLACSAGQAHGVLVEGHGIYAWGADISCARRHLECLEFLARMRWEEAAFRGDA